MQLFKLLHAAHRFEKNYVFVYHYFFLLQNVQILYSGTVVAGAAHSITFASQSKKNYDVTETS